MQNLLLVGSMAYDCVETPSGKRDNLLGGAASYIALSCAALRCPAAVVSVVGEDFKGSYLEYFKNHSIDISGIQKIKGEKSFVWKGKYHQDLNDRDTLATELNVLENFKPNLPDTCLNPKIVVLGNLHPNVQMEVLNQLQSQPKAILLDTMNFWMSNAPKELQKIIQKADILTINDHEARELSEEYSLPLAAKIIQKMGPKVVVIKKGEHGALLFYENEIFAFPAAPLEVVCDPTGAGDAFAGGMAAHLQKCEEISFETLKQSIVLGSVMASLTVEKFGPENLFDLKIDTIKERLQLFENLTHCNFPSLFS